MPNPVLMAAARSPRIRHLVTGSPLTQPVVTRFIAGDDLPAALETSTQLAASGLRVTLDRLGEDIASDADAQATADAYLALLDALAERELAQGAEASVKLSALGRLLPDGDARALDRVQQICVKATEVGALVTLDMEDHTTVDATLETLRTLRADFPWVGVAIQAALRRTLGDCRDLATPGSRVRLVKGAYAEPASVAHPQKADVDGAYRAALTILMAGPGYPMVATHDPAMIAAARDLIDAYDRDRDSYEFQMLYGIRTPTRDALRDAGHPVRVYVPYGDDWYGYFMRRLAERPANLLFLARSLVAR